MKKDQIKSRSEYKIMGFTKMKEAIYQASKIGNWDVFEIIEK